MPACYNIRRVISASQDGSGRENRGWGQHKWVTMGPDSILGLLRAIGGASWQRSRTSRVHDSETVHSQIGL